VYSTVSVVYNNKSEVNNDNQPEAFASDLGDDQSRYLFRSVLWNQFPERLRTGMDWMLARNGTYTIIPCSGGRMGPDTKQSVNNQVS